MISLSRTRSGESALELYDYVLIGLTILLIAGLLLYSVVVLCLAIKPVRGWAKGVLGKNLFLSVGLPVSAIAAAVVVAVFTRGFTKTNDGISQLEIKVFSLSFSGPSGPITLWLICYLALVGSMKIASNITGGPATKNDSTSNKDLVSGDNDTTD